MDVDSRRTNDGFGRVAVNSFGFGGHNYCLVFGTVDTSGVTEQRRRDRV
ncbi:MAG: hypothetical protein JWO38_3792 [Gemmataceae bacterium]|nr:hypothetical protein [Gemmataceae bacterium]